MTEAFAVLADGGTVVAANNRLARALTVDWNRRQRAAGLRAWRTPAVLAWRDWIDTLCGRSLARGGRAGARAILTDQQSRLLWGRIVGSGAWLPGAAGPVADLAGQAWRLAQDWRIGPAELAAAADSEDSRAFVAWAGDYRRRCEASGWADAGLATALLRADLQAGVFDPPRRLHLAGFAERTPLQEELLGALAARGCDISEDSAQARGPLDLSHRRCHDAAAELEQAARWARHARAQHPAAVIGVVVPDLARRIDTVRRAFLDVLAPHWRLAPGLAAPVNLSYGQPLAGIGLVRVALAVLRSVTGRLDYRVAGELLATRYLPGQESEGSARARVDMALRERIGTSVRPAALAALAATEAPAFAARFAALAAVVEALPRRQSAGDWANDFRRVLEAAGWPGDAALDSGEFQAAAAWQDLLDQMRSCDAILGPLDAAAVLGVVVGLARAQVFQPAGDPASIQVLGVMEAVGQRFDALWICGMTSEAWPPAAKANPLLPLGLQRERRLPGSSPALAREHAERLLRWLETSAGTVVFSSPEFDGEQPLAPSPLLAHVPAAAADVAMWREPSWIDRMVGAVPLEHLAHDPPPPVARGMRLRGGAALLEREARCPARAFVEFRLGARELPVPAPGLDAATRGSITHRVLETFFTQVGSHAALLGLASADEARLLRVAIDAALADFLPLGDPLVGAIAENERERQARLLAGFLALERRREGFTVLRTESLPGDARLPAALASLQFRLRADRIDEMADGRRLVIDYKTGAQLPAARDWWGPRPRSPQLPLYATMADAGGIAFAQLATGSIGWRGVAHGDCGIEGIVTPEDLTGGEITEWGALRAAWWTALERLATEILEGCFDVDRWRHDEAQGEWAMAIRPHDLGAAEEDGA